jgi:hypothetical protein
MCTPLYIHTYDCLPLHTYCSETVNLFTSTGEMTA